MKSKTDIRQEIGIARAALSPEWIVENSRELQQLLSSMQEYQDATTVGCYLSVAGEVSTVDIVSACWSDGKKVCVPAYDERCKGYGLASLSNGTELKTGLFGIPEPVVVEWVHLDEIDMMIVPGLAFDAHGGRVGHGGGYYDRILQQKPGLLAVAVAFECQVKDEVPMTPLDVRMDFIVTEQRIIPTGVTPGL